jgi:hypothetical protein
MKRISFLVLPLLFVCGGAFADGVETIKAMHEDKGCKNIAVVEVKWPIEDARNLVMTVAHKMNFKQKQEDRHFVYCEKNLSTGPSAAMPDPKSLSYLGFFLESNEANTATTVTIVENTPGRPQRDLLAAKIKELAE